MEELGTKLKSFASSALWWRLIVGGATLFFIASIEKIASTATAAPRRCPMDDFALDFNKLLTLFLNNFETA